MRAERFLRGAALIAGAINSAPLKSASFGAFLAETRKARNCDQFDKLKFECGSIVSGRKVGKLTIHQSRVANRCIPDVSGGNAGCCTHGRHGLSPLTGREKFDDMVVR